MIGHWLASWAHFIHSAPRLTVCGLLLLSLGAAYGVTRFEIDPDVSVLLPEDAPAVELFKATHLGEESSKTLYLLVSGEDLEAKLGGYLERLEESPYVSEIAGTRASFGGDLAREASAAPLWFLPDETLTELEERLSDEGRLLAVAESKELLVSDPLMGREVVKSDPLGLRWILGQAAEQSLPPGFDRHSAFLLVDRGRSAFVRVTGKQPAFNVEFSEAFLADIEARSEDLEVFAAGGYAIAREDSRRIRGDLKSSLQWSIPLLLVFFLLSTRSFSLPHLYLLPTGLAVFWTLGYGGLLLGPMTPLAVSAAAILCGLGVDFSIHYLGRFREERTKREFAAALIATHRATSRSLLGCWLTSSVAFLAFAFGSFAGLRSLGLLLAVGLTLTLFSTWTVLPLLLRQIPRLPQPAPPGALMRAFTALSRSRASGPAGAAILLLAGLGWTATALEGVSIDADPSFLRPADSSVAETLAQLEGSLGFAPEGVTLLLAAERSPQLLVDASQMLLESGSVAFASTAQLVAYSPERAERVERFRGATAGWNAAALDDFRSAGFRPASLRPGLENFANRLSADPESNAVNPNQVHAKEHSYWRASFHPAHGLHSREQRQAFRAELQAAVSAPTEAMDPGALGDAIGPLLAAELRGSVLACSLIVALVILASVGRLRAGLVAMTPVLCGLGVVLGLFSVFGWTIHPGNLLAFPLLIGLGVDDGLHLVHRSLEGREGSLNTTGTDIWRTSVTTAIGFGSLITADSPAIASLGLVVLIGTLTCFVATVVLIPWLLPSRSHA